MPCCPLPPPDVLPPPDMQLEQLACRLQNFSDKLMNWDVTYWAQRQQKALFNLTDEEVRPYFVYDNVLKGLFQVRPRAGDDSSRCALTF